MTVQCAGLDTLPDRVHDGHMTTTQHTVHIASQVGISDWYCKCGKHLRGMTAVQMHEMLIDGVPADEHGQILRDAAREMRRQDSERR